MTITFWKQTVVALPGVGVSLLPKLLCPPCWPAYAGVVSAVGLGFLISTKYLLALTIVFLAVTAAGRAFRSSRRHGLGSFWVEVIAAGAILIGKFGLESAFLTYSGICLLIAASIWNSWLRVANISRCQPCAPRGA